VARARQADECRDDQAAAGAVMKEDDGPDGYDILVWALAIIVFVVLVLAVSGTGSGW